VTWSKKIEIDDHDHLMSVYLKQQARQLAVKLVHPATPAG